MGGQYIKRYPDAAARNRAETNYHWLTRLLGSAHLPGLHFSGERELHFEHIEGHHAISEDLVLVADHLGYVHGTAYAAELRHGQLRKPYCSAGGQILPAFPDGRLDAVARELSAGNVPGAGLTLPQARRLIAEADGPAAFYKDANPRNFLITPAGTPVAIDFDDLTLAPFGYDLAKLIVTLAMTHGRLTATLIADALNAYNFAAAGQHGTLPGVTWDELMNWAEIHHILTSRYTADGRYTHRWNEVRPPQS
jgi:Phosphotransferase enzyme family